MQPNRNTQQSSRVYVYRLTVMELSLRTACPAMHSKGSMSSTHCRLHKAPADSGPPMSPPPHPLSWVTQLGAGISCSRPVHAAPGVLRRHPRPADSCQSRYPSHSHPITWIPISVHPLPAAGFIRRFTFESPVSTRGRSSVV